MSLFPAVFVLPSPPPPCCVLCVSSHMSLDNVDKKKKENHERRLRIKSHDAVMYTLTQFIMKYSLWSSHHGGKLSQQTRRDRQVKVCHQWVQSFEGYYLQRLTPHKYRAHVAKPPKHGDILIDGNSQTWHQAPSTKGSGKFLNKRRVCKYMKV